jgi:RibD C-terminal domain
VTNLIVNLVSHGRRTLGGTEVLEPSNGGDVLNTAFLERGRRWLPASRRRRLVVVEAMAPTRHRNLGTPLRMLVLQLLTWAAPAAFFGAILGLGGDLATNCPAYSKIYTGRNSGRGHGVHPGTNTEWLLDNELVDEINLLTFPAVVGQGTRLFPDTGPDTALELVESRTTPKGVTIQVYRPTGRPQYETAMPDMKHAR